MYDTIAGDVLIDGHNIKEYNIRSLREHIGLVGYVKKYFKFFVVTNFYSLRQEPVLFNMTIKQNILMGATAPVTEQKLIEVCQMANCHNFISMLPDGYETNVGEHGGMLSGGQKQRIGIIEFFLTLQKLILYYSNCQSSH